MDRIRITSYVLFFFCGLAVWWLQLATPVLTVLFSYLILTHLLLFNKKWVAILVFLLMVSAIFYGFGFFVRQSLDTIPKIIANAVPILIEDARKYGYDLPFSDIHSLKAVVLEHLQESLGELTNFAKIATKEFLFLLISLVVAISLFLDTRFDLGSEQYSIRNNLYTELGNELSQRFGTLFRSFNVVMGAQLLISLINTFFTGVFIFAVGLPYFSILVVVTLLCGLLPIIGNLISNTIIFAVAIQVSLNDAILALVYLIVLHKFEYFLNSKIVGGRIKNPMWLTLLAMVVGEKFMGIPGMILASTILNYLKLEGSQIPVERGSA